MLQTKFLILFLFVAFLFQQAPAEGKVVTLNELESPGWFSLDQERLYISDGCAVKTFSRKDFSLQNTIGRQGEGPGEFKYPPVVFVNPGGLWADSQDKVSLFSHSGKLIKEMKEKSGGSSRKPVGKGEGFIGQKIDMKPGNIFITYVLFDSELNAIKEFHRAKWLRQPRKKTKLFEQYFYDVVDDKIVFVHYSTGFAIDILDKQANKLHSIRRSDKPVPFTEKDKQAVLTYWRQHPYYRANAEYFKKKTEFPETYPAICTCRTAGNKIYVITYLRKQDKNECLVYNMQGKFLQRLFIPLIKESPIAFPIISIFDGQLFQIVDNFEKETWDLHIHRIE